MSTVERTWYGAESLEPLLVSIDELSPHPQNPRRGDVDKIATSLQGLGQLKPIVVNQDGVILAGNHTWRAAKGLGWTHIAVVRVNLTEHEARAYLIADNRTADVAAYENEQLQDVLAQLQQEGMLETAGWEGYEYENYLAELEQRNDEIEALVEEPGELEVAEVIGDKLTGAADTRRQIILAYDPETYDDFMARVGHLEKRLGTNGLMDTVYRALRITSNAENYKEVPFE